MTVRVRQAECWCLPRPTNRDGMKQTVAIGGGGERKHGADLY
jgi:hypothetical protein